MNALVPVSSLSFFRIDDVNWQIDEPEAKLTLSEDKYIRLSARASVGLTVEHDGEAHRTTIDVGFRCTIDPKFSLDMIDVDQVAYLSFAGPPSDGGFAVDPGKNRAALEAFSGHVLRICGRAIGDALDELLQVPSNLLAYLRGQIRSVLEDELWGFTSLVESACKALEAALASAQAALTHVVSQAHSTVVDAGTALVTSAESLLEMSAAAYANTIQGLQELYASSRDRAEALVSTLVESAYVVLGEIAALGDHFGQFCLSVWLSALRAGRNAKKDLIDLVTRAIAKLVEAKGWVADQIDAAVKEMHLALVMFGVTFGEFLQDVDALAAWIGEFSAAVVTQIYVRTGEAADILCGWLVELGNMCLDAVVLHCKFQFKHYYGLFRYLVKFVYWGTKAVYAVVTGDEAACADVRIAVIDPMLRELCEKFDDLKVMAQEEFADILVLAAEYGEPLLESMTLCLLEAQDLIKQVVGEENYETVVAALEVIRDFMVETAKTLQGVVKVFHDFAAFLSKSLQELAAPAIEAIEKLVAEWRQGVAKIVKTFFHAIVESVAAQLSGVFAAIRAMYELVCLLFGQLADIVAPALRLKKELAGSVYAQMEELLVKLRDTFVELFGGGDPGATFEFALQSVAMGAPRLNQRSQTSIEVVKPLPDEMISGSSVLYPVLRKLGAGDDSLGVLWIGSFLKHRYFAPHPASMMVGPAAQIDPDAPREPDEQQLLAMPVAGSGGFRAAICLNPVCYAVDPRYSWGYGASSQFKYADIDGDGRVEQWEIDKKLQDGDVGDLDSNGVADARDVQLMLDQAKNVLHGVPYRQLSAPVGVRARWADGSWIFFTVASIGDEDIGMRDQAETSADTTSEDPNAPERSVKRVGAGGTALPPEAKLDRRGIGYFLQGQVDIKRMFNAGGAAGYPIVFHYESREFVDTLECGLYNKGQSDFFIVRGGPEGNDFQARLFSYMNPDAHWTPPWLTITPTVQLMVRLGAGAADVAAAEAGVRFGLKYTSKAPIAEIAHTLENLEKNVDEIRDNVVGATLDKISSYFGFGDVLPNLRRAIAPLLSAFMHDRDFEAGMAVLQALFVGESMDIDLRLNWARRSNGRNRLKDTLMRASGLLDHWESSVEVRKEVAALLHEFSQRSEYDKRKAGAKEELDEKIQELWRNPESGEEISEETARELQRMQELRLRFMREIAGENIGAADLEDKFEKAWEEKDDSQKADAFRDWMAGQQIEFYFERCQPVLQQVHERLLEADFAGAMDVLNQACANLARDPASEVSAYCEATLGIAALLETFTKMITVFRTLYDLGQPLPSSKKKEMNGEEVAKDEKETKQKGPSSTKEAYANAKDNLAYKLHEQRKTRAEAHKKLLEERAKAAEKGKTPKSAVDALKEHSKFGVAFAEINADVEDPYWAYDFLEEPVKTPESLTTLGDDAISFVWGADTAAGVGLGAEAGGAGASLKAVGGVKFTAPSFTLPVKMFEGIPNKLRVFRFIARIVRHMLPIYAYERKAFDGNAKLDWDGAGEVVIRDVAVPLLLATIEALQDLLQPEGGDPEWLEAFLSGCVLSTGVSGVIKGQVTGAVAGAKIRLGAELTLSTSLASLLDPLIAILQRKLPTGEAKVLLHERLIPKVSVECAESVDLGVTAGPIELALGGSAKALEGDVSLPNGSAWRKWLEIEFERLARRLQDYERFGRGLVQRESQEGGRFRGACALLDEWDRLMGRQIAHLVANEESVPKAILTNPIVEQYLQILRDPDSVEHQAEARNEELTHALEAIAKCKHGCFVFPGTPGQRVKVEPIPNTSEFEASVLVAAEDADFFGSEDEYARTAWQRFSLDWKFSPAPVDVRVNAYATKGQEDKPVSGIVAGFAKKEDAVSFLSQRPGDWVHPAVAGVQPWPSPHAGGGGRGEWYVWVTTKVHELHKKYKEAKKDFVLPRITTTAEGMKLSFALVERDLAKDEDLAGLPVTRTAELELYEIKVLTGARPDDLSRLRTAAQAAPESGEQPKAQADGGTSETSAGGEGASSEADQRATQGVPYSVERAQRALNFALRQNRLSGVRQRLVVDNKFGSKTRAALDAWASQEGISGEDALVEGIAGAGTVQLGRPLQASVEALRRERDETSASTSTVTAGLVPFSTMTAQRAANRLVETGEVTRWGETLWRDGRFGPKTQSALEAVAADMLRRSPQFGVWVEGTRGGATCHLDPALVDVLADAMERLEEERPSTRDDKPDEPEVDPDDQARDDDEAMYLGWDRVPVLSDNPKIKSGKIRSDFAAALRKIHETLVEKGSGLTGGGYREPSAKVTAGRSATSLHMLGRAWDLDIYKGFVNPEKDRYVVVSEADRWRVYARVNPGTGAVLTLQGVKFHHQKTIGGRPWGTFSEVSVTGEFVDLTAMFADAGFVPIRPRRAWREPKDGLRERISSEWWHFESHRGMVKGKTTFGEELLRCFSLGSVQSTDTWQQSRLKRWNGGYFP